MTRSDNIERSIREGLAFRAGSELRERLWADVKAAQAQTKPTSSVSESPALWRIVMKSRITQVAAALVLLAGLVALSLWGNKIHSRPTYSTMFSLLSAANAAEQSLFYQSKAIRYMANEIVLHARKTPTSRELLDKLQAETTQENNLAFVHTYLNSAALPLSVLDAQGQAQLHNLALSGDASASVTLVDESWYDSATGRFVRILRQEDRILFANAYDGQAVYLTAGKAAEGLSVERKSIAATFQAPTNPADFLGLAAGIATGIPKQELPPIQDVYEETLSDGTPVRVYQMGFKNIDGELGTYYLFKLNQSDRTLAEIVCVANHQILSEHRRLVTEVVDQPGMSWDLQNLKTKDAAATDVIAEELAYREVTPRQMAEAADFNAAIFTRLPAWTHERSLIQGPDPIGSGLMFAAVYQARDGRHVVMTMARSFHQYMETMINRVAQDGHAFPWDHRTPSGYRIMRQRDQGAQWWTEIAMKNCGFDPAPNRQAFFCQTPEAFNFCLAVNGPVSDKEMRAMADSLIAAGDYRDPDNSQ